MFDPDAFDMDITPRWTGWSRRAWNTDLWIGPVPLGKTLTLAALLGGITAWL